MDHVVHISVEGLNIIDGIGGQANGRNSFEAAAAAVGPRKKNVVQRLEAGGCGLQSLGALQLEGSCEGRGGLWKELG